jgi:hypothetical protein
VFDLLCRHLALHELLLFRSDRTEGALGIAPARDLYGSEKRIFPLVNAVAKEILQEFLCRGIDLSTSGTSTNPASDIKNLFTKISNFSTVSISTEGFYGQIMISHALER